MYNVLVRVATPGCLRPKTLRQLGLRRKLNTPPAAQTCAILQQGFQYLTLFSDTVNKALRAFLDLLL